ncbi:hypothetical protein PoB_001080300 [Plakobranchus ocellatus]|uniref:Uncharacterized protein n=1 Tax=Plakobranchus ocellatus TaxID=259542 RepID=A0AAV3YPN1_9GAST|nr:hypothetical protein PoB_001080300 [Plakobranchus ocellatus]
MADLCYRVSCSLAPGSQVVNCVCEITKPRQSRIIECILIDLPAELLLHSCVKAKAIKIIDYDDDGENDDSIDNKNSSSSSSSSNSNNNDNNNNNNNNNNSN